MIFLWQSSQQFVYTFLVDLNHVVKTWNDYRNGLNGNRSDFLMEDLNEMVGEIEDAFFTIKSFKENQIIEKIYFFNDCLILILFF